MSRSPHPSGITPKQLQAIGCGMVILSGLIFAVIAWPFIDYMWDKHATSTGFDKSTPIGDAIIVQLEAYKSINGDYPETLEELVTAGLLPKIVPPTWGERKWRYSRNEDGTFYLAASKAGTIYPIMAYDSTDGYWWYDS